MVSIVSPSFVVGHPSFVVGHPSSTVVHPSFAIVEASFAAVLPSFAAVLPSFVVVASVIDPSFMDLTFFKAPIITLLLVVVSLEHPHIGL